MTTDTQKVVFSVSVAVPFKRKKSTSISPIHRLTGASRAMAASLGKLLTPGEVGRPARTSNPARCSYLECSLMAREAYRL